MQILTREVKYPSRNSMFRFYFLGDIHWGSALCDENRINAILGQIAGDPHAQVFLMGDLCDYISTRDWRYEPDGIADWVNQNDIGRSQEEYATEKLLPIRRKIVGAIQGNHERTMEHDANLQVHQHLCENLQVQNLGYSALVRNTFCRGKAKGTLGNYASVTIYLHHGYGGGRSAGADANRFAEMVQAYQADWYVAGHTHRRFASSSIQHYIDRNNNLNVRRRLFGRSGTFLKGVELGAYASYSERAGMNPLETGCLIVNYQPQTGEAVAQI